MRDKLKLLIADKGLSYDQAIEKMGWTRAHFFDIIDAVSDVSEKDVEDLALLLGERTDFIKLACTYSVQHKKYTLKCPWCQDSIEVFANEDIDMMAKDSPRECPSCHEPIMLQVIADSNKTYIVFSRTVKKCLTDYKKSANQWRKNDGTSTS